MVKRPVAVRGRSVSTGRRQGKIEIPMVAVSGSRIEQLVTLADHCSAARDIAESLDEGFLVHLLSMVLQETHMTMRRAETSPDPEQ